MKNRNGFVSNSSSTSFIITNISGKRKTLVDFVKENPQLIEEFKKEFSRYEDVSEYTQEKLIESARENNIRFYGSNKKECVFGDESGTLIGQVFDYMLRDGGSSESFTWEFNEYYR